MNIRPVIEFAFRVLEEQLEHGKHGDQEYIQKAIEAIEAAGSVEDIIRLQDLLNKVKG